MGKIFRYVEWLSKYFEKIDCLIDLGVGHQFLEAHVFKYLYPSIEIFGFEPSFKRFKIIKDNYPGSLYNLSVGSFDGTQTLYEAKGTGNACLNFKKDKINNTQVKVNQVFLDNVANFDKYNNIFIWADIEGSELEMLTGCKNLLSNKAIGLNLELYKNRDRFGFDRNDIARFLSKYNFSPIQDLNFKQSHKDIVFKKL